MLNFADPPRLVGELAAALGVKLPDGAPLYGSFPPGAELAASFSWDMHHEAPVSTAAALARRELTWYSIPLAGAEAALRDVYGPPRTVAGRRRYGPFFAGATVEWFAQTPDWALPPVDLAAALASGERELEFRPPVSALELAAALGVGDAVARTVDVHMRTWEVKLGDAVATLDGPATGETFSLPAARGARLAPGDRVRALRFSAR